MGARQSVKGTGAAMSRPLTISQIMILLHYYVMAKEHPDCEERKPSWRADIDGLFDHGLIAPRTSSTQFGSSYEVTKRGGVYCEGNNILDGGEPSPSCWTGQGGFASIELGACLSALLDCLIVGLWLWSYLSLPQPAPCVLPQTFQQSADTPLVFMQSEAGTAEPSDEIDLSPERAVLKIPESIHESDKSGEVNGRGSSLIFAFINTVERHQVEHAVSALVAQGDFGVGKEIVRASDVRLDYSNRQREWCVVCKDVGDTPKVDQSVLVGAFNRGDLVFTDINPLLVNDLQVPLIGYDAISRGAGGIGGRLSLSPDAHQGEGGEQRERPLGWLFHERRIPVWRWLFGGILVAGGIGLRQTYLRLPVVFVGFALMLVGR